MRPVNKTSHELLNGGLHEGQNEVLVIEISIPLHIAYIIDPPKKKQLPSASKQIQHPLPAFTLPDTKVHTLQRVQKVVFDPFKNEMHSDKINKRVYHKLINIKTK